MPRDPPVTSATFPRSDCIAITIAHRMQEVAIIGAGELGGAVAHALARSNLVRSIRLIDETGRVAAGKALDIAQAAPIEGFATRLSGANRRLDGGGRADRDRRGPDRRRRVAGRGRAAAAEAARADRVRRRDSVCRARRSASSSIAASASSSSRARACSGRRRRRWPLRARALVALAVNGSPRDVALVGARRAAGAHGDRRGTTRQSAGFALTRRRG